MGRAVLAPLLAAKGLGAEAAVSADELPMAGAEDFSYFLMPEHGGRPGCFFFLGGQEESHAGLASLPPPPDVAVPGAFAAAAAARRSNCICHGTSFDFNDNLIPPAAVLWVRLVERRLGVRLYGDDELAPGPVLAAAAQAAQAIGAAAAPGV